MVTASPFFEPTNDNSTPRYFNIFIITIIIVITITLIVIVNKYTVPIVENHFRPNDVNVSNARL